MWNWSGRTVGRLRGQRVRKVWGLGRRIVKFVLELFNKCRHSRVRCGRSTNGMAGVVEIVLLGCLLLLGSKVNNKNRLV